MNSSERALAESVESEEEAFEAAIASGAQEIEAPAKDLVERMTLEQSPDKDGVPEHVFEKIQTLEEFQGGRRRLDGEDELQEHQEALSELDLRQVIRGGPQAESVYRADLGEAGEIPDVRGPLDGEQALLYDEWDLTSQRYRRDWVAVFPATLPRGPLGWSGPRLQPLRRTIESAVRRMAHQRQIREQRKRQLDGPLFDLAAVVDFQATLKSGHTPSPRVHLARRPLRKDQATTLLLDISLSADAWVEDQRILDRVLDSALVLGEVAAQVGDPLQILAFASNTRRMNRVWTFKAWDEAWPSARDRLGLIRPQGYTRMGP
ncbi:MAG: hypothetical protein KDB61_14670, partial [Planctomycetes bacterium]|nr:hypothetical protein [Planctomycetota bacterium]